MTAFVLNNSVTMRWRFENTSIPFAEAVLEQLVVPKQAYVPVLRLYEVVSVPAKAQRTASITADKAHGFLEDPGHYRKFAVDSIPGIDSANKYTLNYTRSTRPLGVYYSRARGPGHHESHPHERI